MKSAKEIIKVFLLRSFFRETYDEYKYLKKENNKILQDIDLIRNKMSEIHQENTNLKDQTKELKKIQGTYKQAEIDLRNYTQTVEGMYKNSEKQLTDTNKTLNLIKAYFDKQLNRMIIKSYEYGQLHKCLDVSIDLFKKISNEVYEHNIQSIKEKNKIKIAFLAVTASTWSCEALYKKLINDDRFEVDIIISPFENGTKNTILETYNETKKFFDKKGYRNVGIYDNNKGEYMTYEDIGSPDILFHLNPHTCCIPDNFKIENIPLNVLNIYIPYGIMTFGMTDIQYNLLSHHLCWKIFCESEIHKEMAKKYSIIGDFNVEVSGYLKMDEFINEAKPNDNTNIWKTPLENSDLSKIVKIIYAPHHTLGDEKHSFSTFSQNYMEIFEYAKTHPKISWIYKPHPLLKQSCVKNGLFKNEEEYDHYVLGWEQLPNARVIIEDSYVDIFKTSDGIILDSVSFLSEYLYVHKPIVLLTRDTQTFNDYGEKLREVLYKVDGNNIDRIFDLIEDVFINKNDTMKTTREEFYEKYLNYKKINKGLLASDYIYNYLTCCIK